MKNTPCYCCPPVLAVIVVALVMVGPLLVGNFSMPAWAVALCGAVLARLAIVDMATFTLPNHFTIPLLWGGLLANSQQLLTSAEQAIIGSVTGWALFTLIRSGYWLCVRREGLGGGDVKLFAALGAWGGPLLLAPIMAVAALLGIVTSALVWSGGHRRARIPFGPALALSGWGWLMWALYSQTAATG